MSRRQIGQEQFWGSRAARPGGASLDEVAVLLDWTELDQLLAGISASAKGEPGWPPLALFRALLLATWHDLSDVRLAEAFDDRGSFRRFCGFSVHEATPECTAFVRFRSELVRRGLDHALFTAVTRQLDTLGVVVRTGTLVDATLIPLASTKHDEEARWAGHRRRKPLHGYKVHVATDQEAVLVRGVKVTTANAHDASRLDAILPDAPGDTYGDSAYQGDRPEGIICARVAGRVLCTWADLVGRRRQSSFGCTTPRCAEFAAGSKRCSAPPSAPTDSAGCAGSGWQRPAYRSG